MQELFQMAAKGTHETLRTLGRAACRERDGRGVQVATWGSVPGFCFFLIEICIKVSTD